MNNNAESKNTLSFFSGSIEICLHSRFIVHFIVDLKYNVKVQNTRISPSKEMKIMLSGILFGGSLEQKFGPHFCSYLGYLYVSCTLSSVWHFR